MKPTIIAETVHPCKSYYTLVYGEKVKKLTESEYQFFKKRFEVIYK